MTRLRELIFADPALPLTVVAVCVVVVLSYLIAQATS